MTGAGARTVLVSYAHEDADGCESLQIMLRPVVRPGRVRMP
jgi:hypothetical protein